jgi:cell division protein FtsW
MAAKRSIDPIIFTMVVFLAAGGLLMVYSASALISQRQFGHPYHYLWHQGFALVLGFAIMVILMRLDLEKLQRPWLTRLPFILSLGLLVWALASAPVNGTHRWIRIFGLSFQPSEVAKVALLIFLADLLSRRREELAELRGPVLGSLVATGVVVAMVARQPDLGTAMVIALIGFSVLFASGIRWRYLLVPVLVLAVAAMIMVQTNEYQMRRISSFLNPEADPEGGAYQVRQSVLAVAAGGLTGRGLGEGGQKLFFLPYPHTDFIFSNIGEEVGLLGTMTVLGAFLLLMARGLRAAARAPSMYLSLVAYGATVMLVGQALINMGVCLEMLPTKGLPLPFVSYGGSSLLTSMIASGFLLNASQHAT